MALLAAGIGLSFCRPFLAVAAPKGSHWARIPGHQPRILHIAPYGYAIAASGSLP